MRFGPHTTWFRRTLAIAALVGCAPAESDLPPTVDAQQQTSAANGDRADVHPRLAPHLVAHYDFERDAAQRADEERDRGPSGTPIRLLNGGAAMRVADGAHRLSAGSLQVRQNSPTVRSNDDWKAGLYVAGGAPTLARFRSARGISVMGWFKLTGEVPSPNSNTTEPRDRFDAVGLAGVLTGDSDGHAARALLEAYEVSGQLRLVALGRRVDGDASHTFASRAPLAEVLPRGTWVFLAATFDFETGAIALYRNGEPLPGFYGAAGDPWKVRSGGPHRTSATLPRGLKIGGSFPQNQQERNPCDGRIDSLMFLDAVVPAPDVRAQYQHVTTARALPDDASALAEAPYDADAAPEHALAIAPPVAPTLGLVLRELADLPRTSPTPAPTDARLVRKARINYVGELPDGSGRLYVPDLNGPLYFLRNGEARVYADVAAAFAPRFHSGRGMGSGFGFVAFHPEFAQNGKLYTAHTESASVAGGRPTTYPSQPGTTLHGVVTEWTARDPSADSFAGTRREILRLGFAGLVHGIQQIDFNPTAKPGDEDYGLLYLGVGDGGIGAASDIAQDLSTPAGKILRIDPLGRGARSGTYGIPARNPFVGRARALGEIWALGMRDPHRFSWDVGTPGRLLLGHIGEHAVEAVYDVRAGDNLGWSEREGAGVFRASSRCSLAPLPADDRSFGFVYPVAAYEHRAPRGWNCSSDLGFAIAGGFVVRGAALPALAGKYVFGDLVNGAVYYAESDALQRGGPPAAVHALALLTSGGARRTMADFAGSTRVDLRFGSDRAGGLYLLSKANGKIWKVVATQRVD